MAVTLTITDNWSDGKRQHVIGTLAFSGNYVTNGEVLALTNPLIKSQKPARLAKMDGKSGYIYQYDRSTGKLLVFQQSAATSALTQVPAAAYPGGVTGDVVDAYFIFDQLR